VIQTAQRGECGIIGEDVTEEGSSQQELDQDAEVLIHQVKSKPSNSREATSPLGTSSATEGGMNVREGGGGANVGRSRVRTIYYIYTAYYIHRLLTIYIYIEELYSSSRRVRDQIF